MEKNKYCYFLILEVRLYFHSILPSRLWLRDWDFKLNRPSIFDEWKPWWIISMRMYVKLFVIESITKGMRKWVRSYLSTPVGFKCCREVHQHCLLSAELAFTRKYRSPNLDWSKWSSVLSFTFHLCRYPQASRARALPPLLCPWPQVVPLPHTSMLPLPKPVQPSQPHQSPYLPQPQQDIQSPPTDFLFPLVAERVRIRQPPHLFPHLLQRQAP